MRFAISIAILAACQREPPKQEGTGSDCAIVVQRVQAAVQPQIDSVGRDAQVMITRMMPAMQAACVEDKWPATLTSCIIAAKPGNISALQGCNSLMSKDLQDKLQKRIMTTNPLAKP